MLLRQRSVLSTCGLMFNFFSRRGLVQAVHLDLVVEVADVADDGLVFIFAMCSNVMMSQLPVVVT